MVLEKIFGKSKKQKRKEEEEKREPQSRPWCLITPHTPMSPLLAL